jgi:hypothetical protein
MWEAGGDYNDTLLDSISVSIPLAAIPSVNAGAPGEATLYQLNTTGSQPSASPTASSSSRDLRHNSGQWRSFFTVIALCAWICSR